jgi:hypothetical protein
MDASSALVAELFADSLRFDSKARIQAVLTDLSSAKENRKRVISSTPPPSPTPPERNFNFNGSAKEQF